MGYSPWGHRESDTTEQLTLSLLHFQNCSTRGGPVRGLSFPTLESILPAGLGTPK